MIQNVSNYLITGDNCTALLDYNLEIIHNDIVMFRIFLVLAVIILLMSLYQYFKAYAKMVGYEPKS